MADIQPAVTLQEWVATTLEFTLQKTDVVWAKPLLQRVVSEVPHATRNKVSEFIKAQGAYLKPKHSSASGKCETAFWGVRYRTVPLNSDASQATQPHSTPEVASPPTLLEWFAKTIEGMRMTFQEFCAILDAWPTSSQLPDEVILLDYKLEPFMAFFFCTNRYLETARLIFEESQRSGQVPWCWLDGTGKVIWQRLRILLLGGLTMNHTTALFSFSLAEKENTDALHFILECTSRAITTRYPGFTWSMGKFMSDGDPAMYNAAKRV